MIPFSFQVGDCDVTICKVSKSIIQLRLDFTTVIHTGRFVLKFPHFCKSKLNFAKFELLYLRWTQVHSVTYKVIHPKYYKHLKKCTHQRHGLDSGNLACTSSKTEILNKIFRNLDFNPEFSS